MDVLAWLGVVAVVLGIAATVSSLTHAPTRRAYKELWTMRLREFKEHL